MELLLVSVRSNSLILTSTRSIFQILCCREPVDTWTGKWFPAQPTEAPAASMAEPGGMDGNSMWKMINATCDDGKVSLVLL